MKRWARAALPAVIGTVAWSVIPVDAAEVYRWIDERGIVNYSNEPPPKDATAKDVRTVEDRLSVYTPEKKPERPAAAAEKLPPSSSVPAVRDAAPPERRAPPPPPPVPLAYDPCLNVGNESSCYGGVQYPVPVYPGRRSPRLVQPEISPGTIAGQSTSGGATIPGQSANAPPLTPPRSRKDEPSASFTTKGQGRDRDRERDGRR